LPNWVVGGVDIDGFARPWLEMLGGETASMRGLLEHVYEEYDYGAHFMMANIGPQASVPEADRCTLLLYGVLAAYQNDGFPGAPDEWPGFATHLENALDHANELTDKGVADNLLRRVIKRTLQIRPTKYKEMIARSQGNDPARAAAHEQDMAGLDTRDVRAAELFDSSVNIDDIMWSEAADS
jgi:hypothetical protein